MDNSILNSIAEFQLDPNLNGDQVKRGKNTLNWAQSEVPADVADPELFKACQGFESYFARMLVKEMRGSLNVMGEGVPGADTYQSMFDEMLGEKIAGKNGLGIAEMMYRQMMQENGIQHGYENDELEKVDISPRLEQFDETINSAAKENGIDPDLIKAIIQRESGGNPYMQSKRGGKGIMGLTSRIMSTADIDNPFDPNENIKVGASYLGRNAKEFNSNEEIIAAWHAGPDAVRRFNGVPPFPETKSYVEQTLNFFDSWKGADDSEDDISGRWADLPDLSLKNALRNVYTESMPTHHENMVEKIRLMNLDKKTQK